MFENKRGPKKRKGKKTHFVSWKAFYFLVIFSLFLFLCTCKMISRPWGNALITFLNHAKKAHIMMIVRG